MGKRTSLEKRRRKRNILAAERLQHAQEALKRATETPSQRMLQLPSERPAEVVICVDPAVVDALRNEILAKSENQKRTRPKKEKKQHKQKFRTANPTKFLRRAHPAPYSEYLRSSHWEDFKQKYYVTHERKCSHCGYYGDVHLHHKTYIRLYCERESDVIPLCRTHHAEVHRYAKAHTKLTLQQATEKWLEAGYRESKITAA